MNRENKIKKLARKWLPIKARYFLTGLTPKISKLNTYKLVLKGPIKQLSRIDVIYEVKEVSTQDIEKLQKAHLSRGPFAFKRKVWPRLNSTDWTGLAVFDKNKGDIAYIAWIVTSSIPYSDEFKMPLGKEQFLLKDGFCVPEYRHQGIHTRMEQERINFCWNAGAREVFIQIHDSNDKGKRSVFNNGYKLYRQSKVIMWPTFNVYREFRSFIKNPFKKVIK